MARIFISYASSDTAFYVDALYQQLQLHGYETFYDARSLSVGREWEDKISRSIAQCDAMVVVLNNQYSHSPWVEKELEIARKSKKNVLPIMLQGHDARLLRSQDVVSEKGSNEQEILQQLMASISATNESPISRAITQVIDEISRKRTFKTANEETTSSANKEADQTETEKSGNDSDGIAFTHFYPAEVASKTEAPLHVYVHLNSAIAKVKADFEKRRNFEGTELTDTQASNTLFQRGTVFRIEPTIKNARVIPASMDVEWLDDFEHIQFNVKPVQGVMVGTGCSGHVRVFVEGLCVAELPIIFRVGDAAAEQDSVAQTKFPYKKIFISYAHEDQLVVKLIDRFYARNPELETIVDFKAFRGGDDWWEEAKKRIGEAEALQLFWSQHSADSEPVQREWNYALDLPRPIIPIMLKPEAPIPERLKDIIFGDFDRFLDSL